MKTVNVTLHNRLAHLTSDYPFDALRDIFSYRVKGYQFSPKFRLGIWDGYIRLLKRGTIPTGCFLELQKEAETAAGIKFQVKDERIGCTFSNLPDRLTGSIRTYQTDCVDAMTSAANTGGLILSATGSGKTFVAGAFLSRLQGTACFVVDELTLLEQARTELKAVTQEPIGIVGQSQFQPTRLTVATIQTLHKHRNKPEFQKWYKQLDVLIIDEIHIALNRRNIGIVQQIHPKAVYGLTATLELQKRDVLLRATALAGPVIYRYPLAAGVEEGVLSKGIVCRVRFTHHAVKSNYQSDYRHLITENGGRNTCIQSLVEESVHRGYRTVVLAERVPHLQILSQRLLHIPHAVVYGKVDSADRMQAKKKMDKGKLPLILANVVFAKGVNIKSIDVIIDATAGRSKNSAQQRYGRGARTFAGKQGLIYLDISDVGNRFQANASSRAKAYATLQIPVVATPWDFDAKKVLDYAVRHLPQPQQLSL